MATKKVTTKAAAVSAKPSKATVSKAAVKKTTTKVAAKTKSVIQAKAAVKTTAKPTTTKTLASKTSASKTKTVAVKAATKSVLKKPTAKKSVAKKPAAAKPVVAKPVAKVAAIKTAAVKVAKTPAAKAAPVKATPVKATLVKTAPAKTTLTSKLMQPLKAAVAKLTPKSAVKTAATKKIQVESTAAKIAKDAVVKASVKGAVKETVKDTMKKINQPSVAIGKTAVMKDHTPVKSTPAKGSSLVSIDDMTDEAVLTPPSKAKPIKAEKIIKPKARRADTPGDFQPYHAESDEEYMNAEQLEHFRGLLNKWKQELMEEVDRTVHHMQDESANLPDPADRATQEEEFTFELRTRDRERKLIKKIDQALEALDDKDYGYCESCGVEIGIRRLEARPTATLCIDCKTLDEIKEKQLRGS